MTRLVTLAAFLALSACFQAPAAEIVGPKPLVPPTWYAEAWQSAVACAGDAARPGVRFDEIEWKAALSIETVPYAYPLVGLWTAPRTIYVVQASLGDRAVIEHELLHHILGPDQGHGSPRFEACDPVP